MPYQQNRTHQAAREFFVCVSALGSSVENLVYTGTGAFIGAGNELANMMFGGNGADRLAGGGDNDALDGGTGADTLWGGAGDDTYRVDNAGDVVTEGKDGGTDTVISTITYALGSYTENLTLIGTGNGMGNKFANVLRGSDSADTLDGLFGADRLTGGGGGNDTLTGGRDADIFVFKPGFGHDTITDFHPLAANHDILEFDASMFADAGALLAHSADTAEGVLVTFDIADTLLLKGTTLAQLATHPEDFHFV